MIKELQKVVKAECNYFKRTEQKDTEQETNEKHKRDRLPWLTLAFVKELLGFIIDHSLSLSTSKTLLKDQPFQMLRYRKKKYQK